MSPPHASTVATLVLVPLLAWRVVARFRRATGRQRFSRYRGPVSLSIYAWLIAMVALANRDDPLRLVAFAAALAVGGGLATFALARTRFEPTPRGLYYTPHAPIGVALAVLFVARLAWRVVEVYFVGPSTPRSFAEFAHSPLTLGAFGLMAGYYAWYTIGLVRWRRRVLQGKRAREARASVEAGSAAASAAAADPALSSAPPPAPPADAPRSSS